MNAKNYFSRKSYNQKDWLSSSSYKQAMSKHFDNAKPYLTETAVAVGAVVGLTIANSRFIDYIYKEGNSDIYAEIDSFAALLHKKIDQNPCWSIPIAIAPPVITAAGLSMAVPICKVAWDEGGFSFGCIFTGLYKAFEHLGNAWHGSKEIAYGIGNLAGCCGTFVLVDVIYDHVVMPLAGEDILHIH